MAAAKTEQLCGQTFNRAAYPAPKKIILGLSLFRFQATLVCIFSAAAAAGVVAAWLHVITFSLTGQFIIVANGKLSDMKKVYLVVLDLFLPTDFATEVRTDLRLPSLERMLARGASTGSARTDVSGLPLENYLCELFGVPCQPDAPIAPVSAAFDGLGEGIWLRADPVHLRLQREQLVLLPEVEVSADEAGQLCIALNEYFIGQGMEFFAPHPQRWYMRLDKLPDIETVPLSQAIGCNVRGLLPKGKEAARWHQVFNEIQMLLFAHPVNEAREARGELPVNSLWLWGGGCGVDISPQKTYDRVRSDELLVEMFAATAGISFSSWPEQWRDEENDCRQLLVWTGLRSALQHGDLDTWRAALQEFEKGYAQPLWQALRAGKISQLQVDILGGNHIRRLQLNRTDAWAFWRRAKPFAQYSLV